MTTSEIIIVVAAVGVIVGSGVFLLMAWRLRNSSAAAEKSELTPEQLRGVSELTEQLERLIKDIDGKIADHLSRIEAAMVQADAKTAQLQQAAMTAPPPLVTPKAAAGSEQPLDVPKNQQLAQAQSEEAGRPIWEPAQSPKDGQYNGEAHPAQDSSLEDEPVTLPGTWPVPPSRPEIAPSQAAPRNASKLQSPRHAEVLRLQEQGLAAPDIARKLRMDIGEVELVLRLHGAGAEPC
jgi:hypothetical protein